MSARISCTNEARDATMKALTAAKPTRAAQGDFPGGTLMLRYSLAGLLIAIVVVSVGCAAITHPTPLWSQIVFTAVVVMLLAATTAAIVGGPRPFAAGFAVFGWGYLLLASGPWSVTVRPHLLTETALARLEPLVVDPGAVYMTGAGLGGPMSGFGGGWGGVLTGGSTVWLTPTQPYNSVAYFPPNPYGYPVSEGNPWLRQIGHTLWAILFAAAGGALARFAAARKKLLAAPAPQ
jgi:hypothetical protein